MLISLLLYFFCLAGFLFLFSRPLSLPKQGLPFFFFFYCRIYQTERQASSCILLLVYRVSSVGVFTHIVLFLGLGPIFGRMSGVALVFLTTLH